MTEAAPRLLIDAAAIHHVGAGDGTGMAVLVEEGRIASVEPRGAFDGMQGVERLGGPSTYVLPGLVNAHQHGMPHGTPAVGLGDGPLEPWMVSLMSSPGADPYLSARRAAAQQLRSGTTTTVHVQVSGAASVEEYDEAIRATLQGYTDAGIRVIIAVDLKDRGEPVFFEGRFLEQLPPGLRERAEVLRVHLPGFDQLAEVIQGVLGDIKAGSFGDAGLMLGPSGPVWCSDELFRRTAAFAEAHTLGITSHVLESPYERSFGPMAYDGRETVAALDELGVLGPGFLLAHGCQLDEADAAILAARGSTVVTNPGSNLRLHNGVAPVTMLLDAGVNVAVGTDSTSIGDRDDLLDELRLLRALQRRMGAREGAIAPAVLADIATVNGARSVGRPDLGQIAVGAPADLVLVDLDRIVAPGTNPDLLAATLGIAHPEDLSAVIVHGRVVVRDGVPEVPGQPVPRTPASEERLALVADLMPHVVEYYAGIAIPHVIASTTLLRGITVLAMDDEHGAEPFVADVLIDGTRIAAVGTGLDAPPGTTVIDGRDRLVMPGLVNAHLHSVETPFKGRYDGMPLEVWMLYVYPILGRFPVSERLLYLRTMVVGIESLKNGVTCVLDDIANQGLEGMAAVFSAYDDIGIRANVSDNMINRYMTETLPFFRDLLPQELLDEESALQPPTTEGYLELCTEALRRFDDPDGRLRFVIAPSAPQRCTDELLIASMELAHQHDTSYHIHVLETKVQQVTGQEHYGRSLVQYLADLGVLRERTTLAHGIWLTDDDIALLADAGASVAHNPISNQKLGAGIAPFRKLRDAGVNLGLGTDGISSNDSARMFDVMKSGALLHHVTSPDPATWPTASELLHAGTIGGARSANVHHRVGTISPGMEADLVVLDLTTVAFTPRNDLRNHLVYCEGGESIEYVYVAGEVVVDHGVLTRVDEAALLAEFRAYMPEFLAQWEVVEGLNRRFQPAVDALHDRCSHRPTGINRYSGPAGDWERPDHA